MKTLLKLAARNKKGLTIIRDCILFDGNTARSTDLECYATTTGNWMFTTPTLVDIGLVKIAMKLSKKPIWLNDTLNGIKLVASDQSIADYPIVPFNKPFTGIPLVFNGVFSDIVDKLMPACGDNDVRYYLNGIHFNLESGAMVTADGHRLHVENKAFTPTFTPPVPSIIVPRSVFDLVNPTGIEVSNDYAKVYHADGVILVKLIDDVFPDYKRVMPDLALRPHTIQVNSSHLDAMNKIVAINKVTRAKFGSVRLQEDGNIQAKGITLPFCDTLPIAYGFNAQYLADALKAVGAGTFNLGDSPNDSALLASGNFQAVIMPMRV